MTAKCLQRDDNGKPTFKYVCAAETNVALTIKRELKRLAELKREEQTKVTPMRRAK